MIHEHKEQNWLNTVSLAIIAVVAAAAALVYTRVVMIPFVVALFIVALVSPVEDFQVKCLRLPRAIAIVVTLLVVIAVVAMVFLLVAQATTIIVSTAGEYSARFAYMANKILEPIEYIYRKEEPQAPPAAPNDTVPKPAVSPNDVGLLAPPAPQEVKPVPTPTGPVELFPVVDGPGRVATLEVRPPTELPKKEPNDLGKDPNSAAKEPNETVSPGAQSAGPADRQLRIDTQQIVKDLKNYIFNIVTNAFGTILGMISSMLFVIIFVLFLLLGRNPYTRHSQVYTDVVEKIRKYVGIKIAISAITGVLVWVTLTLIGLELAGVFGILAFLLNF
ncbi:MAG: AI-2E family transporter, partial [Phycisphaerales bacterium]